MDLFHWVIISTLCQSSHSHHNKHALFDICYRLHFWTLFWGSLSWALVWINNVTDSQRILKDTSTLLCCSFHIFGKRPMKGCWSIQVSKIKPFFHDMNEARAERGDKLHVAWFFKAVALNTHNAPCTSPHSTLAPWKRALGENACSFSSSYISPIVFMDATDDLQFCKLKISQCHVLET